MNGLAMAPPGRGPSGLPQALAGLRRTAVMGIINVTADSFSDGGRYLDLAAALRHAEELVGQGADIIDVGGESTAPGAVRIPGDEERRRVLPVVAEIQSLGVAVSVDTMRATTAAAAVDAGADLINDVSGGLADSTMLPIVAGLGVPYVIMHWRGHSDRLAGLTEYSDVVAEVASHLGRRVAAAREAGIAAERVVVDPGLGFAKQTDHNWQLLHHLDAAVPAGFPVLLGASRKRFIGATLGGRGQPRPVELRDAATGAISALAAAAGVWCVRVHDVVTSSDAVRMTAAWQRAAAGEEAR